MVVAGISLSCTSLTTCVTFGTAAANTCSSERFAEESTWPFSVTTPFLMSYLIFLDSSRRLLCNSAASRFFAMALSKSELMSFAVDSSPGGRTAI